jgi:hypothetical protein
MLTEFDAPIPSGSCARRSVSTVAPQALTLMNDAFVRGQARLFAERCLKGAKPQAAEQVRYAYRMALARPPTDAEMGAAREFLKDPVDAGQMTDLCQVLMGLNEFVYVD